MEHPFIVTHSVWPSEADGEIYWRIEADNIAKYLFWKTPNQDPGQLARILEKRYNPLDEFSTLGFNTVPQGDWNVAELSPRGDDKFVIVSVEKQVLVNDDPSFEYPKVSSFDVALLGRQRDTDPNQARKRNPQLYDQQGIFRHLLVPKCSQENFGVDSAIIYKVINLGFDVHRYNESRAYSIIADHDIAPRILARLVEHGTRHVGFVIEHVPARFPTIHELAECRTVLSKFHNLGLSYGPLLGRDSFLIVQDSSDGKARALLQGFRDTEPCDDRFELEKELEKVEHVLSCEE